MCAKSLFKEALDYYLKVDSKVLPINLLHHFHHNIGVCYAKLRDYGKSLIHLTEVAF